MVKNEIIRINPIRNRVTYSKSINRWHILTILGVFLLILPIGYAYVPIEEYKGIRLKFYIDIDKEECYNIIDQIPLEYFEGISYIRITKESIRYSGEYYWGSAGINLYGSCSKSVLIHELAHHCQEVRGDYLWQGIQHTEQFKECEDEIWESLIR